MTRYLRGALVAAAGTLALTALAAWAVDGFRIALGPLRVSATDPARIMFQAAAAWLLAGLLPQSRPYRWPRALVPLVALLVAAVLDSSPRRVGDGAEYVAMAMRMSVGSSPALSRSDIDETAVRLTATPGFADAAIDQGVMGRGGRQDFYHFWLYPLLVSPIAAIVTSAGVHMNHAFTILNVGLFALLLGWLVREDRRDAAALLAAGPLLWWTDKAHPEVFLFVTLAFAMLLATRSPLLALVAAALAAAQNPGAAVVLAACIAGVMLSGRWRAVPPVWLIAPVAIAALAPAYYLWHLGRSSPLLSTIDPGVPGVREVLTPLIDPNLGLLPHAPVLVLFACLGAMRAERSRLLTIGAAGVSLLLVFAQTANVNHGATPGMSRYGLWLLALAVPLVAEGCARIRARSDVLMAALGTASVVLSLFMFRPDWPDRAGDSPNALARLLWTRWPAFDNPLPEVFAERMYGLDGIPALPVGTGGCEKVLTVGDGADVWWPAPCSPRPAPAECSAAGALCYVNNGVFAAVPLQRHFEFERGFDHATTARNPGRLDPVLRQLGGTTRFAHPGESRRADGSALDRVYIVEGDRGTAAWVRTLDGTKGPPQIGVRVDAPSALAVLDPGTLASFGTQRALAPGRHVIVLPPSAELVVVVSESPGGG